MRADAGDRDAPVRCRGGDHDRSTANVSVPRAASSPPTRASARPLPIGPRTRSSIARQLQLVAGLDDPLEADAVDAREQREPTAVLLLGEHGDGAGLRHRLDDQDPGHDRPAGEVPREVPLVRLNALARDRTRSRLQLDDLVDQQEGITMRQDRLDLCLPKRCLRLHAAA